MDRIVRSWIPVILCRNSQQSSLGGSSSVLLFPDDADVGICFQTRIQRSGDPKQAASHWPSVEKAHCHAVDPDAYCKEVSPSPKVLVGGYNVCCNVKDGLLSIVPSGFLLILQKYYEWNIRNVCPVLHLQKNSSLFTLFWIGIEVVHVLVKGVVATTKSTNIVESFLVIVEFPFFVCLRPVLSSAGNGDVAAADQTDCHVDPNLCDRRSRFRIGAAFHVNQGISTYRDNKELLYCCMCYLYKRKERRMSSLFLCAAQGWWNALLVAVCQSTVVPAV